MPQVSLLELCEATRATLRAVAIHVVAVRGMDVSVETVVEGSAQIATGLIRDAAIAQADLQVVLALKGLVDHVDPGHEIPLAGGLTHVEPGCDFSAYMAAAGLVDQVIHYESKPGA